MDALAAGGVCILKLMTAASKEMKKWELFFNMNGTKKQVHVLDSPGQSRMLLLSAYYVWIFGYTPISIGFDKMLILLFLLT